MLNTKVKIGLMQVLLVVCCSATAHQHEGKIKAIAKADRGIVEIAQGWIKTRSTNQQLTADYVKAHMAESGIINGGRYVGFGFVFDPENEGRMVVARIVDESPASKVLEAGDEFVEVNGVEVNQENMDKLSFRGKPGEQVQTVLIRDGKKMSVSIARGIISNVYGKTILLDEIASANPDNWGVDELTIHESVRKDNVVYVWSEIKDVDWQSKLPYESHVVTRFVFDDHHRITRVGELQEDRFVLEQQGFQISR
jgi:hypothetical protein